MTLSEFLAALKSPNVQVVVTDLQDVEICKIFASSYTALDESVSERTINRWTIKSATLLEIVLNDTP
ncbi:hypothetical protein [Pseudobutyrivibrio sp.]|uniref:hypothetical protein n=1 Tax=Pseudobutyrivibrio sp. TaxID=2014367 RepID=UPI00386ABC39